MTTSKRRDYFSSSYLMYNKDLTIASRQTLLLCYCEEGIRPARNSRRNQERQLPTRTGSQCLHSVIYHWIK